MRAFKLPELPVIPESVSDDMRIYLDQINDLLLEHIAPAMYLNDRLYEIDQLSSKRDADIDYDAGDLTTDGNWHELDLSSIVGSRECSVKLYVALVDDAVGSSIQFRANGDTYDVATCRTQVIGVQNDFYIEVPTDSDGIIEYKTSNLTFTTISISIKGWYPVYVIGG